MMEALLVQLLNALVYGVLLFMLSVGLSLVLGLMNVVSLTHGSFFMLGAYLGWAILEQTGSFWLALLLAPLPVVLIGGLIEIGFLRPLYKRGHLHQVLMTFGFTFVFADLVKIAWGTDVHSLKPPAILAGVVPMLGGVFPTYRLFLIGFGLVLVVVLWLLIDRSRLGAMVRASVDSAPIAEGMGVNVSRLFSLVFALGAGLAALAGVVAAPILGVAPGMDVDVLIPAFIVIVIGGMGNLRSAFVGSMLVGAADTFGKAYVPQASLFLIYLVVVLVLLVRPQGLVGMRKAG
jgi:branched-subunit amino acid ABC-type transport system permease component